MSETTEKPPVAMIHHHPAVKWMLMVAMLAVAGLGLPKGVSAAAPSVSPPTGPQSGGVFTGPFNFAYYISCSNGVSYNSSYNSNLDGTNTFAFYGSADGSLLVSVDGGGQILLSSCGDPDTGRGLVVSYTVSKNTAAPTPTPPPTPTPTPHNTPAPTPTQGGGGTGGNGGNQTGGGSGGTSPMPTPNAGAPSTAPTASAAPARPGPSPTPTSSGSPVAGLSGTSGGSSGGDGPGPGTWLFVMLAASGGVGLWVWRSETLRRRLRLGWAAVSWRVEPWVFRLRRLARHHAASEARRPGLSHHRYSGKMMAHHHTSYPALAFVLVVGTIAVTLASFATHAADSTLSLSVSGDPPSVGATITDPSDGASTNQQIITVRGTCGPGLRVELTRGGTFAGSTICDGSGLFNLVLSLSSGANLLRANNYDGADQPGPATPVVTVTYIPPATPSPTPTPAPTPKIPATHTPTPTPAGKLAPAAPLVVGTDQHYFSGVTTGQSLVWPLTLSGGTPPFAFSIDWGDSSTTRLTAGAVGNLSPTHIYTQPGTFHIVFRVTDRRGQAAAISVVALVGGAAAGGIVTRPPLDGGTLVIAWPILIGTCLVVLSFWLGERDRLARHQPALVQI